MKSINPDLSDGLLYVASLPERLPRAAAAGAGGVLYESSLVLLPEWARRSQLYQALVGRMLRITVEWVGGVKGIEPADPITAGRLATRKVAGNVMEFTSIFMVGWSPLWMLAAAADLTDGAKVYLHAMTDELKRLQLLTPEVEFSSVDGLLESLNGVAGVLSKAVDIPPLARDELTVSIQEMQQSWQALRQNAPALPSAEQLNAIGEQMQQTAERENTSVWVVSSLMGYGALRAGIHLGEVHIYDYYRQTLSEIWADGLLDHVSRVNKPYLTTATAHLDPKRISYTEYFLKRLLGQRPRPQLAARCDS